MQRSADDTTLSSVPAVGPSPLRGATPSAYLVVISGPSFGEMYRLKGDRSVLGRAERADIRVLDDGVSREHAAIQRDGGKVVLVDLGSTNGTFCNGTRIEQRHDLSDEDQIDETYQKKLFESALRDGLTSTFNRRYFTDRLHAEIRFAHRHEKSLALLFVDIDHFKAVNDTHGHPAGDAVLAGVARLMTSTIRTEDVLARYGGEEFAVICREIGVEGATALGERLRVAVESHRFEHDGQVIAVTVSVGVAVGQKIDDTHALIAAADAAMYDAKRAGRNRVCLSSGLKTG
jgi:diguanylate cyclase (GGDEF)-like protein